MSTEQVRPRPIRSYVIRSGRLTEGQEKALQELWPRYGIEYDVKALQLDSLFPKTLDLVVEIGFGMGSSLLETAIANPQQNFIGIEVHRPGVGKLLAGIAERKLENLKVICHDATEVLANCFPAESIERILIFFPDPWHKKRHNKRRLIQPEFAKLLRQKLKPSGQLHLATDWQPYAEHMLEVMEAAEGFANVNGPGEYWPDPDRPETKFEQRGRRLGHGVWDLLYKKLS